MRWHKEGYFVSDEKKYLNYETAARLIMEETSWGKDQQDSAVTVRGCIDNSAWVFGVYKYENGCSRLVGIARVISDKRTFGYLCDVVIESAERRHGLGKWLLHCISAHPEVAKVQWMMLFTQDAHGLYSRFGYREFNRPELLMVRCREH